MTAIPKRQLKTFILNIKGDGEDYIEQVEAYDIADAAKKVFDNQPEEWYKNGWDAYSLALNISPVPENL